MQLSRISGTISLATVASAVTVSYDRGYDEADRSLTAVACSDGENGLTQRYGWTTQGQVANFPNIGGAVAVGGWNSAACGTCWKLEYKGHTVNVLAVDHANEGYNIGLTAMNALTNGQAEQLGRVDATATEVEPSVCGIEK